MSGAKVLGGLFDARAALVGRTARYTAGPDCSITIVFDDARNAADVTQQGSCASADFGPGTQLSGHYRR
jgi:hypothetical protein